MRILLAILFILSPMNLPAGMTVTIIEEDGEHSAGGGGGGCSDVETTNLVAYWKFDEGVGASVNDEASGSTHDLSLVNTPTWTTGQCSGGLSFAAASSERGDAASPPIVGSDNSFTICAWVNSTYTSNWGTIYGEGNDGTDTQLIQFAINGTTVGDITFAIRDDASASVDFSSGDINVNDGAWHHVCIVNSAANSRELFMDGSSVGTDTTNIASSRTMSDSTVGVLDRTGFVDYMEGTIDNLRIYSVALNSTQISNIYSDEN